MIYWQHCDTITTHATHHSRWVNNILYHNKRCQLSFPRVSAGWSKRLVWSNIYWFVLPRCRDESKSCKRNQWLRFITKLKVATNLLTRLMSPLLPGPASLFWWHRTGSAGLPRDTSKHVRLRVITPPPHDDDDVPDLVSTWHWLHDPIFHWYLSWHSTDSDPGLVSERWGHGLPPPTLRLTTCLLLLSPRSRVSRVSQNSDLASRVQELHCDTWQSLSMIHTCLSAGTTVALLPSMQLLQPMLSPPSPLHSTSRVIWPMSGAEEWKLTSVMDVWRVFW